MNNLEKPIKLLRDVTIIQYTILYIYNHSKVVRPPAVAVIVKYKHNTDKASCWSGIKIAIPLLPLDTMQNLLPGELGSYSAQTHKNNRFSFPPPPKEQISMLYTVLNLKKNKTVR